MMAPAAVGVALFAGPFVRIAVAQQFQAQTIAILPLAVFAGAARALRVHTGDQTALLVRRTRSMTVFNFIDAVAALAGGAIGEYFGGVVGAAAGCLAGTLMGSAAAMSFVIGRMGLRLPLNALGGILAATAIMGVALRLVTAPVGALGLATQIAAGVFIYAAAILALFPRARSVARRVLALVGERRSNR
jgi:O-antigen/teichoic acid export membrane protein